MPANEGFFFFFFLFDTKEWVDEYERKKARTLTRPRSRTERRTEMLEKAKNFARSFFLYFIDLVIE